MIYRQDHRTDAGLSIHGRVSNEHASEFLLETHMRLTKKNFQARMLLNYKQLHYKTEWVEYPQVVPLIEPQ